MSTVRLIRFPEGETSTRGVLLVDGIPLCTTLENLYLDNLPNESCIPAGEYICKRIVSPKFGDTFLVTGTVDRTHIVFHWGNTHEDTLGCVLLGSSYGYIGGVEAILSSRKAFKSFMNTMSGFNDFRLIVGSYT